MQKGPYDIPKHRFEELKHFCMQYPDWIEQYKLNKKSSKCSGEDPTATKGVKLADYARCIDLIIDCAKETEKTCWPDIVTFVTTGVRTNFTDEFYISCRRFYWILDKRKGI